MDSQELDAILWRHISSLPYFRGFLRAVEDRFYQEIKLPEPVFDLGSGDGHFASVAFDRKLSVGLDPWVAPMREAQKRDAYHLLVLGEGAHIPFEEGHFGSVISTSVLEHIPNLDPVLAEVHRIIKPGGKFVFCVPNHRFPKKLWGRKVLKRLGLSGLGEQYSRLFNWVSRHAHTDSQAVWKKRLESLGFELSDSWSYFPPKALHILEWGHPLGLPALISKKIFGRWILVQKKWNLAIPWAMTRPYLGEPRAEDGVCTFFVARRKA
ncbi:MAG: class I SAM-dependent methyltransferase [Brevefilum sp.]